MGNDKNQSYFCHKNMILFQDSKLNICQSNFGVHENICILFVSFNDPADNLKPEEFGKFIFESQTPKYKFLHKKYISIMNPEKFEEQKVAMKAYDNARDKTPKRKKMHDLLDQVRDKTPKRKNMHKVVDQKRGKPEIKLPKERKCIKS